MERKAYVENNDFKKALDAYLDRISVLSSESIPSEGAAGRVNSKAVYAKVCDPCYNAAAMDGIAVFSENTLSASDNEPLELNAGVDFAYVNTGKPISPEFDSVIMIEDVLIVSEDRVKITAPSHPWQHIRVVGESVVATEMVLPGLRVIRPVDLGAILASGNDEISVIRKPRVGIIPTGNEMVESAHELKVGALRESNTRVFAALTEESGGIATRYPIVGDDIDALESALLKAAEENDMVVVNAGSSAGTKDFTVNAIEKLGKVYTHGLAIKPGKPTILGEINSKPVIGVPGYPVSAYIVFERVVCRVIEKLGGRKERERETVKAELTKRTVSALKHEELVRVALGDVNGRLVATPLERGAAAVMSMVKADGIMTIPRASEGFEAGEIVDVELTKPLSEIKRSLVIVGSHDMIIDVIGNMVPLSSAHVGSLSGITAMMKKAAHVAPIHLLDGKSGEYNVSYVKKYFPRERMALVKGVGRIQGILTEKGNPLNIKSIADIAERGLSFANRQGGAGTRILFDHLLEKSGLSREKIKGYDKEFTTHLAVATAVKNKAFDCGLAVKSAANVMDLDFIPVGSEEYDFLIYASLLDDERFKNFLAALKSEEFKRKLDELGGYGCERSGEIRIIE